MINDTSAPLKLASTAALLISGGDERLNLDAITGRSRYGCQPTPDPELTQLGSATASNISPAAFQAAAALRDRCEHALRSDPPSVVYGRAMARVHRALLDYCGCAPSDGTTAVLAASGTDIFRIAAQLSRAQTSVLICSSETGSGVPSALQQPWQSETRHVNPRLPDGGLRDPDDVDADFAAIVCAAVADGRRVLLVLTDLSKSGMLAPSIATTLALRARWPDQVEVLVDACQFRLDGATVRAYLAHGCMVALTGSKFMTGPTFSGALLLPSAMVAQGGDPADNPGLLLRWEAALYEMQRFAAVPDSARIALIEEFERAVQTNFAARDSFVALPVAPIDRAALGVAPGWQTRQTVFPFLLKAASGRLLNAEQTRAIYQQLQQPGIPEQRFQLGQPVVWQQADGSTAGALRLCMSARMIADYHNGQAQPSMAANISAALDRIEALMWMNVG